MAVRFDNLRYLSVIDACAKGNLGRFINHSCEPNCRTEKWMVNGEVCIGIFALRYIKKGEEVTFDYNYVWVFGAAAKKCVCGSSLCRGYIGGDPLNAEVIVQGDSDEEYLEPVIFSEDGGDNLGNIVSATSSVGFTRMGTAEKDVNQPANAVEHLDVTKESSSSFFDLWGAQNAYLEDSSNDPFEAVQVKLNELLDADGGISKRKDASRGYLKLLFLTAASGDSGNGEAIQSYRDLSMILDALLKTKSRTVLVDIINKHGLQMLHNIMKRYRKEFHKIPILRKLLKVLEYLAAREILTLEHITSGPRCAGVESFRESILSLTEHIDKQEIEEVD